MNELEFESARKRLTEFVLRQAEALSAYHWAGFLAHPSAPETFEGVLAEYELWGQGYPFRVSPDNCENVVYLSKRANHAFRFWHDVLHAHHRHDLSFDGEMAVAELHLNCARREFGAGSHELLLLHTDTVGQLVHFRDHGKHVDNQLEFAKRLLIPQHRPKCRTEFSPTPMTVAGVHGYAIRRSRMGTVRYYGSLGVVRIMSYDRAATLITQLCDLPDGPDTDWVEREGAHNDSKKPMSGLPSGNHVWALSA